MGLTIDAIFAKVALAAQVRGVNPASFGGIDLPARPRSLLTPSGRFSDRSQSGDYSNAFGQSLAILALKRTPGVRLRRQCLASAVRASVR